MKAYEGNMASSGKDEQVRPPLMDELTGRC
jgi:hypothetical protein